MNKLLDHMRRFPPKRHLLGLCAISLLTAACSAASEAKSRENSGGVSETIIVSAGDAAADAIEKRRGALIEFRRDLHRNPDLSNEEARTAGKVSHRLKELGFDVTEGVGGHGVVARLEGAKPGPLAAFRADMDAVRSDAPDPAPFASERPGVRHICGHDIHTTIGIALAEGFAAAREQLSGSVMLVFQPAEETASGARDMLADGVFDGAIPDVIFAYHTAPMEVGVLVTSDARLMSALDRVEVTISGSDRNMETAAEIFSSLKALTTVESPFAPQSANSDFISADVAAPRIEDSGAARITTYLGLATTAASKNARMAVEDMISKAKAAAPEADIALIYNASEVPGVVNDAEITRKAVSVARAQLGDGAVVYTDSLIPAFSEDYGHFLNATSGMMFFLGVSNAEKGWVGLPHSPGYMADEEAIFIGAKTMARIMIDRLNPDAAQE